MLSVSIRIHWWIQHYPGNSYKAYRDNLMVFTFLMQLLFLYKSLILLILLGTLFQRSGSKYPTQFFSLWTVFIPRMIKSDLQWRLQLPGNVSMLCAKELFNPFIHNGKWPNILLKSCGVNTARFLKYIWSFYNMHERFKLEVPFLEFL